MRELDAISELPYQTETFQTGAVVFTEGQRCTAIYLVRSGSIELSVVDGCGCKHVLRVAGVGDLLGVPAAMSSRPYSKSAIALTGAILNRIEIADFRQALAMNPALSRALLKFLEVDSQAMQALYVRLRAASH